MHQLFVLFAMTFTEEKLIEMLKDSIEKYEKNPGKDQFHMIACYSQTIAIRAASEGKDMMEVMEELDRKKNIVDAFEYSKH